MKWHDIFTNEILLFSQCILNPYIIILIDTKDDPFS